MSHGIDWRLEDTASELEYRFAHEDAPDLRQRWQALWLLRRGYTRRAVIQVIGIHLRTLCEWIAWYNLGGCAEVARHRNGTHNGQANRLTIEQMAELAAWAAEGTFSTYEDIRHWVADTWHVGYTYDGIRSLVNRIGIHPRVPRPLAAQSDLDVQEA